jgi:hypothetical protein
MVPLAGAVGTVSASTTPTHVVSDQTWTAAGNPYLIDDMLVIMPGQTLTIEEGVVIEFTPTGWLDVRGDLNVLGTAADPVLFTIDSANATSTSQWGGIQLQTDDFDVDLVMRNAIVTRAMNGVFIACCHRGSILIEDSTFLNNNIGINGYAGYDAIINNVVFMNNTVGVASSDKDISYSTFVGNEFGISSATRTDVRYSLFENNDIAAYGGRGVLFCNVIQDNRIGVQAFYQGWHLEHNVIRDNSEIGVITGQYDGTVPHVWGNSFLNNGWGANTVADISIQHTNNINVDFEDNWWGTTDSVLIDAAIHDFYDASNLGIVDYSPALTADPNGTACIESAPNTGNGDDNNTGDDDNNTGTIPDIDLNGTNSDDDDGLTPDINGTEPIDDDNATVPYTNETDPIDDDNETAPDTNSTDPISDDNDTAESVLDPTPRISLWPGKVNQHNENGIWMTDPDGVSGGHPSTLYSSDYGDRKLDYCQKFWPNTVSIELRDFREEITFWTRGNTDPYVSTRDVYECVFGDGSTDNGTTDDDGSEEEMDDSTEQEDADYQQRLADLEERERQAWEDAMEECSRSWAELDEHYMMMLESLDEQMMNEIEDIGNELDDELSMLMDNYDDQYTELLIQLSEAEDEDEAAVIIQYIQSLRDNEQQEIENLYENIDSRVNDLIDQYDEMFDALDDEFEALRLEVEEDCEALFGGIEEQFAAEYEALDSWTEAEEDDHPCNDALAESCDEEAGTVMGGELPGFSAVLGTMSIVLGAILTAGRRRSH